MFKFSYQEVYIFQRVHELTRAMEVILEIESDGKRTHADRNHSNHVLKMLIAEINETVKQNIETGDIPF